MQNKEEAKENDDDAIPASEWHTSLTVKNMGHLDNDMQDELTGLQNYCDIDASDTLNKPFTISEIKGVLRKLKNNKAPGDDQIIYEMLKYGSSVLL
jgi:hypothetical protein